MPIRLRFAFKSNIQSTAAHLVYGTTLRPPGELFEINKNFQSRLLDEQKPADTI